MFAADRSLASVKGAGISIIAEVWLAPDADPELAGVANRAGVSVLAAHKLETKVLALLIHTAVGSARVMVITTVSATRLTYSRLALVTCCASVVV
jgi:ABC-type cobalamin transport system permease subunit